MCSQSTCYDVFPPFQMVMLTSVLILQGWVCFCCSVCMTFAHPFLPSSSSFVFVFWQVSHIFPEQKTEAITPFSALLPVVPYPSCLHPSVFLLLFSTNFSSLRIAPHDSAAFLICCLNRHQYNQYEYFSGYSTSCSVLFFYPLPASASFLFFYIWLFIFSSIHNYSCFITFILSCIADREGHIAPPALSQQKSR